MTGGDEQDVSYQDKAYCFKAEDDTRLIHSALSAYFSDPEKKLILTIDELLLWQLNLPTLQHLMAVFIGTDLKIIGIFNCHSNKLSPQISPVFAGLQLAKKILSVLSVS